MNATENETLYQYFGANIGQVTSPLQKEQGEAQTHLQFKVSRKPNKYCSEM